MAISLEELAVGALEGSAGPWTLAVGAGALAMALAAGSARPLRRMTATAVHAADRSGQMRFSDWYNAVWRGWHSLVEEARTEYEAGRRTAPSAETTTVVTSTVVTPIVETPPPPVVESTHQTETAGPAMHLVTRPSHEQTDVSEAEAGSRKRDQRGRFVRRPTNGTRPE